MKTMYSVHAIYKQCTIIIIHTVHDNLLEFPHVLLFLYFLHVHFFPVILLHALIYGRFTCTMKHACMKYFNMSLACTVSDNF